MIGDASGPQAYLRQVGLGQVLAQSGTETVAANQANDVVASVFRTQAHKLLSARQADWRAASRVKLAVQASVARQLAFVQASQKQQNKLAGRLATARSNAAGLKAARQAALAAQAAAAAARAAAAAGSSAEGPSQAPSWAWGSGASSTQGDVAANWALTQLGQPYQWGAAGPGTYDCSGLTMVAWAHAGVQLLHYTGYQWEEGPHVPLNQLQRGDLLFFATSTSDPSTIHHVGIYIGNGMNSTPGIPGRRAHRQHVPAGRPHRRGPPSRVTRPDDHPAGWQAAGWPAARRSIASRPPRPGAADARTGHDRGTSPPVPGSR